MNCHAVVPKEKAKTFLNVFSCEDCYGTATRMRLRLRKQIEHLLVLLDEWMRVLFIQGDLVVGVKENTSSEDVEKKNFLQNLVQFAEKRHGARAGTGSSNPVVESPATAEDSSAVRKDGDDGVEKTEP